MATVSSTWFTWSIFLPSPSFKNVSILVPCYTSHTGSYHLDRNCSICVYHDHSFHMLFPFPTLSFEMFQQCASFQCHLLLLWTSTIHDELSVQSICNLYTYQWTFYCFWLSRFARGCLHLELYVSDPCPWYQLLAVPPTTWWSCA